MLYVYADSDAETFAQRRGLNFIYRNTSIRVTTGEVFPGTSVRVTSGGGQSMVKAIEATEMVFPSAVEDTKYVVEIINAYGDTLTRKTIMAENGMNDVTFTTLPNTGTVHAAVRDANTRENLTNRATVTWYQAEGQLYAEGAELTAVPTNISLTCSVHLEEALLAKYAEAEPISYTVTAGEQYLTLPMQLNESRTISGTVTAPKNAAVTVTQISGRTGSPFSTVAQTKADGSFAMSVPKLAAKVVVSADGYLPAEFNLSAAETSVGKLSLTVLQGARVNMTVKLEKTMPSGTIETLSLSDVHLSVKNNTTGADVGNIALSGNTVVLPSGVSAGDKLTLTLSGDAFATGSTNVNVGADLTASAAITVKEKGRARVTPKQTTGGDVWLLVYNSQGKLICSAEGRKALETTGLNQALTQQC